MPIKKHIKSIPARLANRVTPLELETVKEFADIDKYDIGLGSVDNTSDLEKPVSVPTQAALDLKENILVEGFNITIDRTDPLAPVVSATSVGLVSTTDYTNNFLLGGM